MVSEVNPLIWVNVQIHVDPVRSAFDLSRY